MTKQAEEHGAIIRSFSPVEKIEMDDEGHFVLHSEGEEFEADCVILATGAVPRKLGIPGEAEFTGRGVSWCATCDGALYKEKVVCVIGGGDAAVEEAMFLTKFASQGPPHPPPRRVPRHEVHPGALPRQPQDRGAPLARAGRDRRRGRQGRGDPPRVDQGRARGGPAGRRACSSSSACTRSTNLRSSWSS